MPGGAPGRRCLGGYECGLDEACGERLSIPMKSTFIQQ